MILKGFKIFLRLLVIFLLFTPLGAEEKIDIWNNKEKSKIDSNPKDKSKENEKTQLNKIQSVESDTRIQI